MSLADFPVGALKAESPLCALWPNRLVPLKTARPIVLWTLEAWPHQAARPAGFVHIANLADATAEQLAAVAAALPYAPGAAILDQVREVAIDENHFEAIV